MKKFKGFSLISAILIALGVIIVGCIIVLAGKGFGIGGGKGDNEGAGDAEAVQADATLQTTEAITTQEMVYIEVTVSENKYIFNNISYEIEELDSLISDIRSADEMFTVRITDEYASSKAYEKLRTALSNEKIKFIEVS